MCENKGKTKTKRVFGIGKLHHHTSPKNFIMFREVQDEYENDDQITITLTPYYIKQKLFLNGFPKDSETNKLERIHE